MSLPDAISLLVILNGKSKVGFCHKLAVHKRLQGWAEQIELTLRSVPKLDAGNIRSLYYEAGDQFTAKRYGEAIAALDKLDKLAEELRATAK